MTITLQDVSMLTGFPIAGQAIVLSDPPKDWRDDIASRYAYISPSYSTGDTDDDEDKIFFSDKEPHGPTLKWLSRFEVRYMPDDVQEYQMTLYLEAYLLWLFGWVMFTGSHENTVDARLIPLARQIAKDDYTDTADDRPTFGTRSCYGPPQWARIQVHNVYDYFTEAFESLRENEVRWTPYTNEEAILHAPNGISILCYRDEAYWMTRKMLVYNIFVEGKKRQADNRYRRSMHSKMTPWIETWLQALTDDVQGTRAYNHNTYEQYMAWYSLQTRIRLLPPEDTDKRGPPTIEQIYDMQLTPLAHLTVLLALKDFVASHNRNGYPHIAPSPLNGRVGLRRLLGARMVRPVPQMPLARPHMIPQMAPDVATSHWQGGFAPFAEPTQSVPLHAPTYGTNPWQGQFMDYSGFRPYTASYGDISSFGGGSSSVPNELRASQTDEAPQVT
uniref:Aminotransferase-like plant mobile domain-containing protein n=1 Tax=Oryza meridionalis TaxID=40149 RepID=A0A0E0E1U0_9ORYZ